MTYSVSRFDEIEEIDDGRAPFRPVRHHFGITSFGVNTFTGTKAGDRIINEHSEEEEQEELYVVLEGRATFVLDDKRVDAPAGTLVYAEPGTKRTAFAEEDGTTLLVVGGQPGEAYTVHGFEIWAPFQQLYVQGKYAEAADAARGPVEAHPEYAAPFYNLACCEALAGRKDDALGHLEHALSKSPEQTRQWASGDSDLDSLRDEPEFQQLFAG
ncbi:MAG TPA: cupin domain-containing protein [Gaiellaceae bacterium]|nr:cupin domain-containing protein [Gaiellaceae bacterium]